VENVVGALGSASYENSFIVCNPFGASWDLLMTNIRRAVETKGVGLVTLDTLANLWQVGDENNQADVLKALRPVLSISRTFGAAFLLVHHDRKESGGGITTVGGSSALPAAVDMVLKLSGVQGTDNRRILSAKGRASNTPAPLLIELDLDTHEYKAIGAPSLVEKAAVRAKVLTMLPYGKPGWKPSEIAARVAASPATLYRVLDDLRNDNAVGWEKKGRSLYYWKIEEPIDIEDNHHDPLAAAVLAAL
jgi:AAA domain